jgi:dienelactone hydrolase
VQVNAATVAHGSLMTIEAIEAIKQPTQFICAEEDAQWPQDFKDKVAKVIRLHHEDLLTLSSSADAD